MNRFSRAVLCNKSDAQPITYSQCATSRYAFEASRPLRRFLVDALSRCYWIIAVIVGATAHPLCSILDLNPISALSQFRCILKMTNESNREAPQNSKLAIEIPSFSPAKLLDVMDLLSSRTPKISRSCLHMKVRELFSRLKVQQHYETMTTWMRLKLSICVHCKAHSGKDSTQFSRMFVFNVGSDTWEADKLCFSELSDISKTSSGKAFLTPPGADNQLSPRHLTSMEASVVRISSAR